MNRLVVYIFFILQYLAISVNSFKCGDVYQLSVSENKCGVDDEGAGEYCDDFGKFINTMKLNNTMKSVICEYGKQPISYSNFPRNNRRDKRQNKNDGQVHRTVIVKHIVGMDILYLNSMINHCVTHEFMTTNVV